MKKVSTLFIMSLALSTSLYSQVTFIPKIGVSSATVSFDENINQQFPGDFSYGSKAGFMIGLAVDVPLVSDVFSLQSELLFHQKGYTSKYADSEVSDSYTHTLNYLELPVLAKVKFGRFYAAAGPYVGFGVGGTYKGTNTYMGYTAEHEGKIKFGEEPDNYAASNEYINAVDFGFNMGAGVKISAIVVDVRYGLGLTDLIDKRDLNTSTRNRSLQFTVGFPLGGKK